MPDELLRYLTPDQLDKLRDGWHAAIVLGPAELDAMHAALNADYHDSESIRVSDEIQRQIKQQNWLWRIGRAIAATAPPDETGETP